MARRRSPSRRHKGASSLMNVGSMLNKVAPWIAFAQQLTAKDMAILSATPRTYTQQGKDFVNILTGRMAADYKPEFTFKPQNILLSPWVKGGIGGIAYGLVGAAINKKVGRQIVPKASLIGRLGGKLAFAGAVGATFDDPLTTNSTSSTYTAPKAPSNNTLTTYTAPTTQTYTTYPMSTGGMY